MTDADGDTVSEELDIQSDNGDRALGYHGTVSVVNGAGANDKTVNITNTYDPDYTNFQTKVDVTKKWTMYRTFSQGNYGSAFTFTLSRQTSKIGSKDLFTIYSGGRTVVYDSSQSKWVNGTDIPEIDLSTADPAFEITACDDEGGIYKNTDGDPVFVSIGGGKYKTVVNFSKSEYTVYPDPIRVTVTVDLSSSENANKPVNVISIEGLAKYAQDGVRYTYKATEEVPVGFTRSLSKLGDESVDESAKKFEENSRQLSLSAFH